MFVINVHVRADADSDGNAFAGKGVGWPDLQAVAAAPDQLWIALVDERYRAVQMTYKSAPIFRGISLTVSAEGGIHHTLASKDGEFITRDVADVLRCRPQLVR